MPRKPHKIESVVFTATEFASLLGVGKSTITKWRKEGLPTTPTGQIPLKAGLRWYLERELAAAGGESGSEWLERWRKARAQREELALQRDHNRLVPLAEVNAWLADRAINAKAILMAIPGAAPSLVAQNVQTIAELLEVRVRAALETLSADWGGSLSEGGDQDADVQ